MKKILSCYLILTFITLPCYGLTAIQQQALIKTNNWILKQAFAKQASNLQLQGQGIVIKVLSDDVIDARHQRFILRLNSGQTLLIAHNIDIAPRLPNLAINDKVAFYGEYEWNNQESYFLKFN
jgi:hypothetical protein